MCSIVIYCNFRDTNQVASSIYAGYPESCSIWYTKLAVYTASTLYWWQYTFSIYCGILNLYCTSAWVSAYHWSTINKGDKETKTSYLKPGKNYLVRKMVFLTICAWLYFDFDLYTISDHPVVKNINVNYLIHTLHFVFLTGSVYYGKQSGSHRDIFLHVTSTLPCVLGKFISRVSVLLILLIPCLSFLFKKIVKIKQFPMPLIRDQNGFRSKGLKNA